MPFIVEGRPQDLGTLDCQESTEETGGVTLKGATGRQPGFWNRSLVIGFLLGSKYLFARRDPRPERLSKQGAKNHKGKNVNSKKGWKGQTRQGCRNEKIHSNSNQRGPVVNRTQSSSQL